MIFNNNPEKSSCLFLTSAENLNLDEFRKNVLRSVDVKKKRRGVGFLPNLTSCYKLKFQETKTPAEILGPVRAWQTAYENQR